MNIKGISVVVGVAAVILLVVLLPIKPGDVPPAIVDRPELGEGAAIGLGEEDRPELGEGAAIGLGEEDRPELGEGAAIESSIEDAPTITESVILTSETGSDFYVDENGTKHYVINASDAVSPGE